MIQYDFFSSEIRFTVTDMVTGTAVLQIQGTSDDSNALRTGYFQLVRGRTYQFKLEDSTGDGFCSSIGDCPGYARILAPDGPSMAYHGANFGSIYTMPFIVDDTSDIVITYYIKFDRYPSEITVTVTDTVSGIVALKIQGTPSDSMRVKTGTIALARVRLYEFRVEDTSGNGFCSYGCGGFCSYGCGGFVQILSPYGSQLAYVSGDINNTAPYVSQFIAGHL